MIIKFLREREWLKEDERGHKLCIIADNCGGQNKNNTVLRLAGWLVDMGYFASVVFIFLVRGHTKNCCDRSFNLLKNTFHNKDLFTCDDVLENFSTNPHCTVVDCNKSTFKDCGKMLDMHHAKLESGSIKDYHVFKVEESDALTMKIEAWRGSGENRNPKDRKLGKRGMSEDERKESLKVAELETLEAPGIREIKQVEMCKKWRRFVPRDKQDIVFPEVSADMMDRVHQQRKDGKANK